MEYIAMSRKEREQLIVFEKLKRDEITQVEAARRLNFSERWVRKKFKRYVEFGDKGLVHKGRGKPSKKRWDQTKETFALDLLRSDWQGFGPTFAAEKLEELHGIKVNKETLRTAMIRGGIWLAKSKKREHRKRRERYPMIGLLIQLDGSPHDWFEGRGEYCTLLVFIDDATSRILWLEFAQSENHLDVMRATKNYIERHGRPHAFYVDFGGVFSVNINNSERDKETQWERAVKQELGIKVLHAHSPQAKGRVERANGTLQDRLIKELRLAGISSIAQANQFLQEGNFIARHNRKFAVRAAQDGNAHRLAVGYELDSIFCIKEERVLANDFVITYNKRIFQVDGTQHAIRPKDVVTVNTHLDKSIRLSLGKTNLAFTELQNRPVKTFNKKDKINIDKIPRKPSAASRAWAGGCYSAPNRNHTNARVG